MTKCKCKKETILILHTSYCLHAVIHPHTHTHTHTSHCAHTTIKTVNIPYTWVLLSPVPVQYIGNLVQSAYFMIDYTTSQKEPVGLLGLGDSSYSAAHVKIYFP